MKFLLPLIAVVAVVTTPVHAFSRFVPRIPNGANVQGVPAVGHADKTGDSGDLDPFGEAFRAAGNQWTTALCQADSDGDGQTNGEELGDPSCTWTVNDTPKFSTGVSSPGDPSSKVSCSVLSSNACRASASVAVTSETLKAETTETPKTPKAAVTESPKTATPVTSSDTPSSTTARPANATEAANAVEAPAGSHAHGHGHGSHDAGSASEYASSAPEIKTPSASPSPVPKAAPTNPPTATSSASTSGCALAVLCLSVGALALV